MPIMDGIEATRTIRQRGDTLPIIALTANVMQKHQDQFREAGCNDFIGKPVSRDLLKRTLKQWLPDTNPSTTTINLEPVTWEEGYSVGHTTMDEQHEAIIGCLNGLIECYPTINQTNSLQNARKTLLNLIRYADVHLKQEELLLSEIGYPALETHIQLHDGYRDFIASYFDTELSSQKLGALIEYLREWWGNHILQEDKAYYPFVKDVSYPLTPIPSETHQPPYEEVDTELLNIFRESAAGYHHTLQEALQNSEWETVRSTAHTVKGSAASFGFDNLSTKAAALQQSIDQQTLEDAETLTNELLTEFKKIL